MTRHALQLRIDAACRTVRAELLNARGPDGHWIGELSSSALSTATAICALSLAQRHNHAQPGADQLIPAGLNWLARNQNADGGWGDTVLSVSNISTTTLCWAAFGVVNGADAQYTRAVKAAEQWLVRNAGALDSSTLAAAIIQRYGQDRTFSVPILTMCALSGRLGSEPNCWAHVLPLPFELAACPHSWFAALRLPVVSYALPALIAMGHVRHRRLPPKNPIARWCRNLAQDRTLRVLRSIQPTSGGFLEATPLTSFVVMSLIGAGHSEHPVVRNGLEFLLRSVRPDGSWPIDTNLATWLTTLACNALHTDTTAGGRNSPNLTAPDAAQIADWLLNQQFQTEHPYTHTPPGGWAWTDLPGGVPDADDTAGALLALAHLPDPNQRSLQAAINGLQWLANLQNRDGGIPTFCRGWGALPFDQSSPDLTAHALRAWTLWIDRVPPQLQQQLHSTISKAIRYLQRTQQPDGSWIPLWFGNQYAARDENRVYGTSRVLVALAQLHARGLLFPSALRDDALRWLIRNQNPDGAWGKFGPPSIEETALALEALNCASTNPSSRETASAQIRKGINWLLDRIEAGEWKQPAPIGFYFAKLWYFEKLYPMIFTTRALSTLHHAQPIL